MMIIGVDYHPSFQAIALCVEETGGECGEQELNHSDGQAEKFYRDLKQRGIRVRVGMEATGYSRWFERLLAELGFELWIGDPAEIKAKRVKKQKTDRNDARLLRRLMLENNFPQIWIPSPENRDLRQLLWHRHRLVQMRTRIMNQLQALARNEGYRWKKKLFSEQGRAQLEKLVLAPWASRRRQELLELLDRLHPTIEELTAAVEREARKRPAALRLMTHPGVGPLTALAYVLIIGTPTRFPRGKQIGTYVGMVPSEDSSAGKQRLGHISKQGSSLLRFLLVEAAQAAVRIHPDWRRRYIHLAMRRHKSIAKVAMGRRLAIKLYCFASQCLWKKLRRQGVTPRAAEMQPTTSQRPLMDLGAYPRYDWPFGVTYCAAQKCDGQHCRRQVDIIDGRRWLHRVCLSQDHHTS
jgi:transposase